MPSKDLLELIACLIPGFIACRIYQGAYPARQKSDFILTTWALTAGLVITTIVKAADARCFHGWLKSEGTGPPSNRFVIALVIAAALYLLSVASVARRAQAMG